MRTITSKKSIVTTILIFAFVLISVVTISSTWSNSDVLADATSSGGSHNGSSGCANSSTAGAYQDTCTGVSWRKFSVSELKDPSNRKQRDGSWYFAGDDYSSDWPSTVKTKCEAIGATEVYRLGLEVFEGSTGAFINLQGGSKEVNETLKAGGNLTFIEPGTGGLSSLQSWKDVEDAFKIAASVDEDGNGTTIDGLGWGGTNWFCYNPEWKDSNKKGEFESETFLETNTGQKFQSGTDSRTTETLDDIETESITLTFYHKIRYKFSGSLATGTKIDNTTTDWVVYDKFDGGNQTGSGTVTVKPGDKTNYESAELQKEQVTVELSEGEEKKVCRRIEYSPKTIEFKYDQKAKTYKANPEDDENDSGICITLKRKKADEEDQPKTGTNSKKFDAYFNSKSEVSSISNNFDIMDYTAATDWTDVKAGKKSAEKHYFFSTDDEEAKVKFAHYLKWDKAMYDVDAAIEQSGIESKEDETVDGIDRRVKIGEEEIKGEGDKIAPDGTSEHPYAATVYDIENNPSDIQEKTTNNFSAGSNGLKKTTSPTLCSDDKTKCATPSGSGNKVWESEEYTLELSTIDEVIEAMSKIKFDSTVQMEIKENLVSGTKWKGDYEDVNNEKNCGNNNCTVETDSENGAGFSDKYTYTDKNGVEHTGNTREAYKYEATSNGLVRKSWELKVVKVKDATASSAAYAEVVRPGDPVETGEIPGPTNTGAPSPTIKYAGEGSILYWKAKTGTWGARKVDEYRSIAFLLDVKESADQDKVSGNIVSKDASADERKTAHKNQKDPCAWYTGHFTGAVWCGRINTQSFALGANINTKDQWWHATPRTSLVSNDIKPSEAQAPIVVPNDVGRKYCHSNGYHWQYYYGISTDGNWYQFSKITNTPQNQYWTNYDAACKTIAKKPSFAVWNSGIYAGSDIVVSSSQRSKEGDDKGGPTTYTGANEMVYESWAEYLVNARTGIVNLTSGAATSVGTNPLKDWAVDLSPMTITNDDVHSIGHSDIRYDSALIDRFNSYLPKITPTNVVANPCNITASAPLSGNTLYYCEGNTVAISTSLIISTSNISSIYQIPQIVIYAPKATKVEISDQAKQIDAWIIAPQASINTCANFNSQTSTTGFGGITDSGTLCDHQLIVNGPIIAQSVELNRTFGADPGRAYDPDKSDFYTPAEVFNLSAENYLWAYAQAGRYQSSYTNAYARELPPRY